MCAGRMEIRGISGTWQLDGLALLHCHSQENLKISSDLLVKAHVLEQGILVAVTGSTKAVWRYLVLFCPVVPFWT